jgi:hypothetical protein
MNQNRSEATNCRLAPGSETWPAYRENIMGDNRGQVLLPSALSNPPTLTALRPFRKQDIGCATTHTLIWQCHTQKSVSHSILLDLRQRSHLTRKQN